MFPELKPTAAISFQHERLNAPQSKVTVREHFLHSAGDPLTILTSFENSAL